MHLEHINLVVNNIESTLSFYQAAFPHWKIRTQGRDDWYGTKRHWVHFGDEYNYLTFNDNGSGKNRNLQSNQLGLAHFAYVVNNLEALAARLVSAGYKVESVGAANPFRKNLYFIDPNGYEVEFVEYLSDIPSQRNSS